MGKRYKKGYNGHEEKRVKGVKCTIRGIMKYLLSIFLILSLCSCASWSTRDRLAGSVMVAATLADAFTTEKMLDEGFYEKNPHLGKYPNDRKVVYFFSLTGALKLLFAHVIPEYRESILYPCAVVNGYYAYSNYRLMKD